MSTSHDTPNSTISLFSTTDDSLVYTVDPLSLVYNLDIFIAGFILFIVLLRLPRGLARFSKSYEWCNGHFLGYTQVVRERRAALSRNATLVREPSSKSRRGGAKEEEGEKYYAETDESHTLYTHTAQRFNGRGQLLQPSYPPHFVACPAFLRPLAGFLSQSSFHPYSNLQIAVMMSYFFALFYAFTYRADIFVDQRRAAWIAASQLPFVFTFAAKNNLLAWLLGLGYQHFNFLHRFVGRMVVLGANVHAIGYFYKWSLDGTLSIHFSDPTNVWGMVTLVCMDILYVFSLSVWRERAYNIFLATHFVGYVVLVPALYFHFPETLPFLIALGVPYCFDYAFRLFKTRAETAIIRPIPSLGATRIEIPTINSGWRAGQHVRLRILSGRLGWFRWAESHPFTIASAPVVSKKQGLVAGERGLVLIAKKTGTWTERLFETARRRSLTDMEAGGAVKVLIEGPYGGPGHAIYSSYSAVVMVVGGSGITFGLSVIQDLVQKDSQAQSRVKAMHLVWMISSPAALTPLLPLFTALVSSCPALSISVYYTRAHDPGPTRSQSTASNKNRRTDNSDSSGIPKIPRGLPIKLRAGRPGQAELVRAVEAAIAHAVSMGGAAPGDASMKEDERGINGVLVGVCGPGGLRKEVNDVVNAIDSARRQQVGGIEVFDETFGM